MAVTSIARRRRLLDDNVIVSLADGSWEILDISGSNVSDVGLIKLAGICRSLRAVDIRYLNYICYISGSHRPHLKSYYLLMCASTLPRKGIRIIVSMLHMGPIQVGQVLHSMFLTSFFFFRWTFLTCNTLGMLRICSWFFKTLCNKSWTSECLVLGKWKECHFALSFHLSPTNPNIFFLKNWRDYLLRRKFFERWLWTYKSSSMYDVDLLLGKVKRVNTGQPFLSLYPPWPGDRVSWGGLGWVR